MSEKIYATVNGKNITQQDLDEILQSLPPQYQQQMQMAGPDVLVEEAINQELFYLDGEKNSVRENPLYKEELARLEKQLLRGISVNEVLKDIQVSDEDARKNYDENTQQFVQPEEVEASHILVETEEEARQVIEALKEKSFEEVAKEKSTCPSKDQGGNLGSFSRGRMVAEFEEEAFKMEVGDVSEPVKTQFGYHIIRLENRTPEKTMEFDEIKDQIKQGLLQQKQQEAYTDYVNKLRGEYQVEYHKEEA